MHSWAEVLHEFDCQREADQGPHFLITSQVRPRVVSIPSHENLGSGSAGHDDTGSAAQEGEPPAGAPQPGEPLTLSGDHIVNFEQHKKAKSKYELSQTRPLGIINLVGKFTLLQPSP